MQMYNGGLSGSLGNYTTAYGGYYPSGYGGGLVDAFDAPAEVRGSFEDSLFKSRYQRNNKSGGLKNLRCFPSCGFRHKERGFCGQPVEVQIHHGPGVSTKGFYCWVEFVKQKDPPPVRLGDRVSLAQMRSKERNKDEPIKPWVRGDRLDEKCTDTVSSFEFNKDRRGWHYGWTSNKHACNAEHCLQCYVFEVSPHNPDELVCRDIFQSPSFMLFCRRRRRFTLEPTAPVAVPNRRSRAGADSIQTQETNDAVILDAEKSSEIARPVKRERLEVDSMPNKVQRVENIPKPVATTTTPRGSHVINGQESNRMEMVMRKLAVIMSRIQQQQLEESGETVDSSKLSFGDFGDDEFANSIFDAIEIFNTMPDLGEDENLQNAVLPEFELTPLNTVPTEVRKPPEDRKKQRPHRTTSDLMIDDIARYLSTEGGFARAVEQLTKESENGTPKYAGFVRIAQEHLDAYRRSRNISRVDFDKVFSKALAKRESAGLPHTRSEDEKSLRPASSSKSLIGSAIGAFSSFVGGGGTNVPVRLSREEHIRQPMYIDGPHNLKVPNIQGLWKQTEESEAAMQDLRQKMGTPWILSKMFEFMESRYEIAINGLEMITRLDRKWISNTTLRFILDGEAHHWGISLPPPFANLSRGWTYRAWVENNKIVITHMIGDQRVTRINWVNRGRTILHTIAILEVQDSSGGYYTEMGRVNQHATLEL